MKFLKTESHMCVDEDDFYNAAALAFCVLIFTAMCPLFLFYYGVQVKLSVFWGFILPISNIVSSTIMFVGLLIFQIWGHLWKFFDDGDKVNNILFDSMYNNDISPVKLTILTLLIPITVTLCIKFYEISLILGVLYILAHVIRMVFRLVKRFNLHEKTPNAHKEASNEKS